MDDSRITIEVTGKGIDEVRQKMEALGGTMQRVTIRANGTYAASGKLTSAIEAQEQATRRAAAAAYLEEQATKKQSRSKLAYIGHIAQTTVLSAAINKLFLEFVDVSGQAIQAVDLMNNFPATMASMGQSTQDATEAMQSLSRYVGQVGGNIEQASSMVTRFTGVTKDVKAATAVYTGLNNALIAGDSSAEEQKQALLQFAQAFERGKPDMREWNSLTQNMSYQLGLVAQKMGYVNANALGQALRDGEESMGAFTTTLTEMATGTGPIAQQAMTRMEGMQFAFNKMKNTMVTGMATIIQTIGRNNIVSVFTFATQVIQVFTEATIWAINAVISLASAISQLFGGKPIEKMKGDTEGMAAGLAAGAAGAGDLGDGLKDAKDDAKELNKSLAGFDKMNVLDKGKGKKDDDDEKKGTVFSADELGKLNSAFDGITDGIAKAGLAAKILAGTLAGFAGIMAIKKLLDNFNDWNNTIKETKRNLGILNEEANKEPKNKKAGGIDVDEKDADSKGKKAGGMFANGLLAGLGAALGNAAKFIWAPIGVALTGIVGAVATALGISFGAAIAVVVVGVALIVAAIWLIAKNWDDIWKFIKDVASAAWQGIQKGWDAVVDFFVDLWHDIQGVWDGVTEFFVNLWHGIYDVFTAVVDWIKEWGLTVLAVIFFPFTLAIAAVIAIVGGIVTAFQWVWDQIVEIFNKVKPFFENIFQAAIDVVIVIWEGLTQFFQMIWDGIVAIFNAAADWFSDVFSRAWLGVTAAFALAGIWFDENVIQPLARLFNPIVEWFSDIFSRAWLGITSAFGLASDWFREQWGKVKNAFGDVGEWFRGIFQGAWDKITGVFSGLWTWFRDNVWNKIVGVFSGVGTTIGDTIAGAFKGIVNTLLRGIIGTINDFLGSINWAIRTINKIPGVRINEVPKIPVPQLAMGGVVKQATLAEIGEDGAEAVVPLERNTEWIDMLAAKINGATGGNDGRPVQLVVQIGEERIVNKVIHLINEKTQMSGRNQVIV